MYSDDIKNLVIKMVKKLMSEDKKLRISQASERICFLTDINKRSIQRWMSSRSLNASTSSTKKQSKKKTYKSTKFDNFDQDTVSRAIKSMFDAKQVVTLKRLRRFLIERHNLMISTDILLHAMKEDGLIDGCKLLFQSRKLTLSQTRICVLNRLVK